MRMGVYGVCYSEVRYDDCYMDDGWGDEDNVEQQRNLALREFLVNVT